ncbi:Solute carrier family 22 member 7, partial [Aphis craccivora]
MEPELLGFFIRICLPSILPKQLGYCHLSQKPCAIFLKSSSDGSGMCFDSNVVHIALNTSETIVAIADFEILKEKASCRNCMLVAKNTYAKELKKIPKPLSGADADNELEYTGTWPYFESLSFLKVILKPRKQDGNIIEPDESVESHLMDSSESTYASLVDKFDTNMTQDHFESTSRDDPQLQEFERSESVMTREYETEARRNYNISSASSSTTATTTQKRKRKDD